MMAEPERVNTDEECLCCGGRELTVTTEILTHRAANVVFLLRQAVYRCEVCQSRWLVDKAW